LEISLSSTCCKGTANRGKNKINIEDFILFQRCGAFCKDVSRLRTMENRKTIGRAFNFEKNGDEIWENQNICLYLQLKMDVAFRSISMCRLSELKHH